MTDDSIMISDHEEDADSSSGSESELETFEYEKRREGSLKQLIVLEKQFQSLREDLYHERLQQVDRRQAELQEGSASDYRRKLQQSEDIYNSNCKTADILKHYQTLAAEQYYEYCQTGDQQDLDNEKQLIYDEIRAKIQAKVDKLKADKRTADINYTLWMLKNKSSARNGTKSRSSRHSTTKVKRKRKPIISTGPFVVYLLNEEQIDSDWEIIRRAAIDSKLSNS